MKAFILPTIYAAVGSIAAYCAFVCVLAIPAVQSQVIYLNKVSLTWFQDVNYPEQWGFLHNQVTPFRLQTPDGESLHAWHILPLGVYRKHEAELVAEPAGLAADITDRLGFRLLRDDPDALLVLYFHGAAGTLGSGWRPPSYRAIHAGAPDRIHTVAIDYRGFGTSTGRPSEEGLLTDALALVDWARQVAGIPPHRIAVFAQSLGTAVATSLIHRLALDEATPTLFAGVVLVAPFADVRELTATYRVAGTVPLLGPVARFPALMSFLHSFIQTKWPSKDKLAEFVRHCESRPLGLGGGGEALPRYHVSILHAEDDYDVPWTHSEMLYWHAVNASSTLGVSFEDLEAEKLQTRQGLGAGGWMVTQRTQHGVLTEHVMKHGLHDRIMAYPAVSSAIMRAFDL